MNTMDYRQHLKGLLGDIVGEYMNDPELKPQNFIDDIKEEIDSWVEYHQDNYVKATTIRDKLLQL